VRLRYFPYHTVTETWPRLKAVTEVRDIIGLSILWNYYIIVLLKTVLQSGLQLDEDGNEESNHSL